MITMNRPYEGVVATPTAGGVAVAAGRAVAVMCTVAGNVNLTLYNGTSITVPVAVGLVILPFAVTAIASSGTTATATYANLK